MENFYRLFVFTAKDNAYVDSINLDKQERSKLINGKRLDIEGEVESSARNISKKFPDILGDSESTPIVSSRCKEIIESLSSLEEIQFIPCTIKNKKTKQNYFLLNCLNPIAAMDRDQSTFTTFEARPDIVDEITNLVFKKEEVYNRHLFKIIENPFHVFISQTLKEIMEDKGITGVKFNPNMDLTTNKGIELSGG